MHAKTARSITQTKEAPHRCGASLVRELAIFRTSSGGRAIACRAGRCATFQLEAGKLRLQL
ncbi:MAG: hypothetical protein ACK4ZJ_14725, partial [Allorhizobium sp.]